MIKISWTVVYILHINCNACWRFSPTCWLCIQPITVVTSPSSLEASFLICDSLYCVVLFCIVLWPTEFSQGRLCDHWVWSYPVESSGLTSGHTPRDILLPSILVAHRLSERDRVPWVPLWPVIGSWQVQSFAGPLKAATVIAQGKAIRFPSPYLLDRASFPILPFSLSFYLLFMYLLTYLFAYLSLLYFRLSIFKRRKVELFDSL